MYCPGCGASNIEEATFCSSCGKRLPPKSIPSMCPFCGADGQEYQLNCWSCGKILPREGRRDFLPSRPVVTQPPVRPAGLARDGNIRSSLEMKLDLLKVAGILIIASGILGIAYGVFTVGGFYGWLGASSYCSAAIVIIGIIAVLGGISAYGRDSAAFSALGAVCGILAIGYYIGAIAGVVGLILVADSYRKFQE